MMPNIGKCKDTRKEMPIFGRRQLQQMLDGLGEHLSEAKGRDLLARLESADPDQALPAEYELSLTWAVLQVAHLEIDKPAGSRNPDIYTRDLLPSGPAHLEVAAVSDASLAGTWLMRRAANIINNACSRVVRNAHQHLLYHFAETSGYRAADRRSHGFSRFFRHRRVTSKFRITGEIEGKLRNWLTMVPPADSLRLETPEIDVVISWREFVHAQSNVFSTMPALAYDLRDNPIHRVLRDKSQQLADVPPGAVRGILLGDAGCSLLRDVNSALGMHTHSGKAIIQSYLTESSVDFVAVFVPRQLNSRFQWGLANPCLWHLYVFAKENRASFEILERLEAIRRVLPNPHLYGYQARSWHEQGMFDPQRRGQYVSPTFQTGPQTMTARISARALQELLAGRMDQQRFLNTAVGRTNYFERALAAGKTIKSVRFESIDANEDDDYIVIEFGDDPAARQLTRRKQGI